MRDISSKTSTLRVAAAQASIHVGHGLIEKIKLGEIPKGDPLEVAKVAAVQAAKQTSTIIPYCHPLPVDFVGVEYILGEAHIDITVTVKAIHKTGVEMEALTAASAAALTIYDMLKMFEEEMVIQGVWLLSKKGGKSDHRRGTGKKLRAAVLVIGDEIVSGKKEDKAGRLIEQRLNAESMVVEEYNKIPDDREAIEKALIGYADTSMLDLVLTSGGTAFGFRDVTPEVTESVVDRIIPGIPEALRAHGQQRSPFSMLSRGRAGIRGKTIIINLPGSTRGTSESLDALFPGLLHSFRMLRGEGLSIKGQDK